MAREHGWEFVLHLVVLLALFLGTINVVSRLSGIVFVLEAIVVVGLVLISAIGMWRLFEMGRTNAFLLVYIVGLLNGIVLFAVTGNASIAIFLTGAAGLVLSLVLGEKKGVEEKAGEVRVEEIKPEMEVAAEIRPARRARRAKKKAKARKAKKKARARKRKR